MVQIGIENGDLSHPYSGNYENVLKHVNSTENAWNLAPGEVSESPNGLRSLSPLSTQREYKPLIEKINKLIENKEPFFSLEFFPPKTANGVANFLARLDRLAEGGPLFADITWHMGSDPGSTKETSSSSIAGACLEYSRIETMLHVTCAQYTREQTSVHLQRCKDLGLRNILALRGVSDLPQDENGKTPDYKYRSLDLVKWIKQEYQDYFNIAVAGYPNGHPDAPSYQFDLEYLKAKVDAGAQFVITQLFFEEDKFAQFVKDCREIGITVPIIPGIMPIQSYDNIRRIAQLSKLKLPQFLLDAMEPIKHNDEAVRNYGVWLSVKICRNLLRTGAAPSVHIYTLNREAAAREILSQLGLWQKQNLRLLPWKPHTTHPKRCREDVRPIFWSSRPKSYIFRTKDWDDFPNGRWGNSSSPAYGDLKDYYLFYLKGQKPKEELLKVWGHELESERDVWNVFYCFITGTENKEGHKVTRLPWNEQDELHSETVLVQDKLGWCNQNGILTVNSQPNVNGAPSTDPLVGWGAPGGYCYQKAYLEFFASAELTHALREILPQYPRVNYHILNHTGESEWTSEHGNTPIAVTWGVFPGSEIAQPTVVDPLSFRVWKDEAFDAWLSQWAHLYPEGSKSREVLQRVHDNYFLITLVDNDFPSPSCLWELLEKALDISKNGMRESDLN